MIPGNASAALIPNFPSSDVKALSLFLIHSFRPFSSLGGGSPPPDAAAAPPLLDNNASTSTPMVFVQHFSNSFFKARNLGLYSSL